MTSTTWTFVPAGVLGRPITDARPDPGVVVCPTVDPVLGTGLPAGGFAAEARGEFGADAARLRVQRGPVAVPARTDVPAAQKVIARQSTQNDGTTLGIHSPGRPQS